jgi:uncharacterized protein
MSIMEILGYIASVVIGITLGLIGGGGSILTVPVLVYILGIAPVLATAYSLFVVGTTSLVGSLSFMKRKLVDFKTAFIFSVPSFIAVFITRKYLVPAIPDPVFSAGSFSLSKDMGIMVFFGVIMLAAAYFMLRKRKSDGGDNEEVNYNYPMIGLEGGIVGVVTGIVGAGGGFLIIPALVLFAKLPMKMAVGTSLLIIAAKSLIGFLGDVMVQPIQWGFILFFTAISVVGIFIGSWLSTKIAAGHLRKGFGWFVVIMAVYIIARELLSI